MILLALVAIGGTTEARAQSWLDQLGKKVKEKAKQKKMKMVWKMLLILVA